MLEVTIAIAVIISLLAVVGQLVRIAYPIMFLLGGLCLGVVPDLPNLNIDPTMILPLFLPPLLMEAAYKTSLREFRHDISSIMLLAIGLVITTTLAVGVFAHWLIPELSLLAALVLGAIISPPDAVAATSMLKHTPVPRRVVTILEGESLVNDATGLVVYYFAVAALLTGQFSLVQATGNFLWMTVAGLCVGAGVGYVYMWIFRYLREPSVEVLSTFIISYVSYLLAEYMHASGVLAVVATGLMVGWRAPNVFDSEFRMSAERIWEFAVFMLNALVFLLIGLYIPDIFNGLADYSTADLTLYALGTCLVAVLVRFVWVFFMAYGLHRLYPPRKGREDTPSWQNVFIISWSGMRGVVSLATALALPYTLQDGTFFAARDLILFLALSVIVFTLVVQGLSMPFFTKKLNLQFNTARLHEYWQARVATIEHALKHVARLSQEDATFRPALERIETHYRDHRRNLGDGPNTPLYQTEDLTSINHPLIQVEKRLWEQVLQAERARVIELRRQFVIGDDIMHEILREIDAQAMHYVQKR